MWTFLHKAIQAGRETPPDTPTPGLERNQPTGHTHSAGKITTGSPQEDQTLRRVNNPENKTTFFKHIVYHHFVFYLLCDVI